MVKLEKQNAELADVRDAINVMQRDAADFKPKEDFGVIIGNPPYYSVYMITSYVEFEKAFGRPATKRRKLYNGNIEVQFYQYYGLRRKRPQA